MQKLVDITNINFLILLYEENRQIAAPSFMNDGMYFSLFFNQTSGFRSSSSKVPFFRGQMMLLKFLDDDRR